MLIKVDDTRSGYPGKEEKLLCIRKTFLQENPHIPWWSFEEM